MLKVVEIHNASSVHLGTSPETRGLEVRCRMHTIVGPRELDDYRLSGVYGKTGMPFKIEEVHYAQEQLQGSKAYQVLTKGVSDAVFSGLQDNNRVLVVGGTCVQAPGTAGGMRRHFGTEARLGIIWLDAHGDINIPETSHSGMLGGMPFAVLLGMCLPQWQEACGLVPPFEARYAIHSDARSFDAEEMDNVKDSELTMVNTADFIDEDLWRRQVQELASKVDTIYLHIDADIVDSRYLPNVNTPEPNGPDIWTLMNNLRAVMDTGKVSVIALASVYFDTDDNRVSKNAGSETAILSGIRMLGAMLEKWA